MKIDIKKYTDGPNYQMFYLDLPVVPQPGDYVSSDKQVGLNGYVQKGTQFWEAEDGRLVIEITIK